MKAPVFTLDQATVKLVDFKPKSVQSGDERGSRLDLGFTQSTTAADLADFHPNLRGSFFKKGAADGDVLDRDKGEANSLRFPQIKSVAWDHKQVGCEFTIHFGIGGSDIVITECEVDNFAFEFAEGGQVEIGFRVRCRPTEEQAGHLFGVIATDIEVSLSPPAQKSLELAA
jgi:hypothetical protein